MGCGGSKLNKDEIGSIYLYYNHLHHRSGGQAGVTKLLRQMGNPDSVTDSGSHLHRRKSVSGSFASPTKVPPMPQHMVKVPRGEGGNNGGEVIRVDSNPNRNPNTANGGGNEVAVAATEEDDGRGGCRCREPNKGKEAAVEDHELKLRDEEESSILYEGPPSFREYCVSSSSDDTSCQAHDDGSYNNLGVIHDNLVARDDRENPGLEPDSRVGSFAFRPGIEGRYHSPIHPEKSDDKPALVGTEKNGRRRSRRFRVGLLKEGSGTSGVRSLWHVPCNPHRLAGKATS
ncbi:hypothetical protein SAY86_014462 [Trapa natans]|uniref:Uncharacterized protein n=1 Tax=Trapa natans TaxID=22666 RepID=A0AAN7L193_TRANT|nr:hypothetical protein SAY86_014462 [Trapa natans]